MAKLQHTEIEAGLAGLPGWSLVDGKLHREYEFADFVHAFGFMASAAIVADKMNHHPEWTNIYNKVDITLSTHDAGGVTELDIALAEAMDRLVTTSPQSGVGIPGFQGTMS